MAIETVGVLGLGLLGRGIAACLLGHGFRVVGYTRSEQTHLEALDHITQALEELVLRAGFDRRILRDWEKRYTPTSAIEDVKDVDFVIESIVEDFQTKQAIFDELESAIRPRVPVASNTSAMPITMIQGPRKYPQRFVGMHWGEPAHVLRFLEIIRGAKTGNAAYNATVELARRMGKNPSLVQKDIRGFITNRLMYAVIREALYLLEQRVGDVETIDRSLRNDMGWWTTIAGPFRWMDLTGLPSYYAVAKDLFPQLSNAKDAPILKRLVEKGARGVRNGRGFYRYTREEAEHWEKVWQEFTWDIRGLAEKYVPVKLDPPKRLAQRKRQVRSKSKR